MSKQTAVEWYESKLIELDIDFGGHKNYWIKRNEIRDHAKAMERQQIENAFYDGCFDQNSWRAEEYFNETYGGDK